MTLDKSKFNINPYYDDFNETKKFLQVLFKPGYSVQARELTQLQSILSNQIGRMADHIFEDGDVIQGGGITEKTVKFIRLDNAGDSNTVDIDDLVGYDLQYTHTVLNTFQDESENDPMEGTETVVIGKVLFALESTEDDPYKILFVDILQGTNDESDIFPSGQSNITTTNPALDVNLTVKLDSPDGISENVPSSGDSILMSIEQGLFYVDGYFVMNDAQTISMYDTSEGSTSIPDGTRLFQPIERTISVGFSINKTIKTASTDISLRDPSQGSYNYNAPGADRYTIELKIKQIPYIFDEEGYRTNFDTDNYFEWARVIKGETFKKLKYPEYAQLEETLARRTYDESGHYTVRPFSLELSEYDEVWDPEVTGKNTPSDHWNNYVAVGIKSGKAYVRGYEFELQNTEHLVGKRARTTTKQNNRTIDVDYGNYVLVEHNMDGITPLFTSNGAMVDNNMNLVGSETDINEYKKVNLSIESSAGGMLPVGCARIFQIHPHAFDQGELGVGTLYRVYLNGVVFGSRGGFDESADLMTLKDVQYISDPTTGKKIFKLHVPTGDIQGPGLYDKGETSLLFRLPIGEGVKEVTGLDYYIQSDFVFNLSKDAYDNWVGSVNAPAGANWQGEGVIDDLTITDEYTMSVDGYLFDLNPNSSGDYGGNTATVTNSSLTVSLGSAATNNWSGTEKKGYLLSNLKVNQDTSDYVINHPETSIRKKILKKHTATITNNSNADNVLGMWSELISGGWGINLGYSDVFKLEKVIEIGTGTDYTDKFTLNNGQKKDLYDHASIVLDRGVPNGTGGEGGAWAPDGAGFKVTFLYFDHQTWGDADHTNYKNLKYPCVVNSYVHNKHEVTEFDNGGETATFGATGADDIPYELTTYGLIPSFTDTKSGQSIELTDALDFRPIRVGKWDINHPEYGKVRGSWTPQDGKLFFSNYNHYLSRIDKIVLTKDRVFKIIEGIPAVEPIAPEHNPEEMMVIYELHWNPYTLGPDDVGLEYQDTQRYTMDMIGDLDDRIKTLEETSSLSSSELDAKIEANTYGDKFMNAMATENFTTVASANVESAEHNVAFDQESGLMLPAHSTTNVNLQRHTQMVSSDGITSSDDNIYTLLPASKTISTVNNLSANTAIYPNPFAKTNWVGNLRLSPSSDDWFDIAKPPKIQNNKDSSKDPYISNTTKKSKGIRFGWGSWFRWYIKNWAGYRRRSNNRNRFNSNVSRRQRTHRLMRKHRGRSSHWGVGRAVGKSFGYRPQRVGITTPSGWWTHNSSISPRNAPVQKIKNKVVDKSIIPKVREKTITLTATNMKPNTRYWVYVNNNKITSTINKNGHVISSDNQMRTNEYGSAKCTIKIPKNNPYIAGKILIRMTDSKSNTPSVTSSAAEAFYVVGGNVESSNGKITSTREISAKRDSVKSERITQDATTLSKGQLLSGVADYFDPLTQIFEIDGSQFPKGIFATSVDLFFREYDSGNLPFSIEIRPLLNDGPHPTEVIPLSEVTMTSGFQTQYSGPDVSDVNRFEFTSPIFLNAGRYALILKTNSTKYTLWGTEFGKKGLTADGSSLISEVERQPYVGSLYLPQNNGSRFEDSSKNIMFRINRATYNTGSEYILYLQGSTADTKNSDDEVITSPDYHEVTILTEYTSDPDTNIKYEMQDSGAGTVHIQPNEPTDLSESNSFDLPHGADNSSALVTAKLSTSDSNITPVLDMDRLSLICSKYEMSENLADELLPEPPTDNTNSVARYIGRPVNTGHEANYVRVSLEASKAYGTNVRVYAKVAKSTDENIDENNYELLTEEATNATNPTSTDSDSFYLNKYFLKKPDGFTDYIIKIVLVGNPNKSDVPKIRALKSFALYDSAIDTNFVFEGDGSEEASNEETGGEG